MKWYIIKKAKNGMTVFKANKKLTDGKNFTDKLSEAFFYHSKESAESSCFYDNQSAVNEEYAKKMQLENISSATAFSSSSDSLYC